MTPWKRACAGSEDELGTCSNCAFEKPPMSLSHMSAHVLTESGVEKSHNSSVFCGALRPSNLIASMAHVNNITQLVWRRADEERAQETVLIAGSPILDNLLNSSKLRFQKFGKPAAAHSCTVALMISSFADARYGSDPRRIDSPKTSTKSDCAEMKAL